VGLLNLERANDLNQSKYTHELKVSWPGAFEVEMVIKKFKKKVHQQVLIEVQISIHAAGGTVRSEVH
jgi:hypothetical protein